MKSRELEHEPGHHHNKIGVGLGPFPGHEKCSRIPVAHLELRDGLRRPLRAPVQGTQRQVSTMVRRYSTVVP